MSREIVFDTETTGMDPVAGHRIIEIGCVELQDLIPTGRVWHQYLNPERDVPPEAVAVHGLTEAFLADKPVFSQVFADMLDFFGHDTRLVAHNAPFDLKFLNAELRAVGHPGIKPTRVLDTLAIVREKFPGAPASLDALCKRFAVDNTGRDLHGALLDAQLLAEVYLALMGGRQRGLNLEQTPTARESAPEDGLMALGVPEAKGPPRPQRVFSLTPEERTAHEAMLAFIADPLWKKTAP